MCMGTPLVGVLTNWPWLQQLSTTPQYFLLIIVPVLLVMVLAALNRCLRPWRMVRSRDSGVAYISGSGKNLPFDEITRVTLHYRGGWYGWSVNLQEMPDNHCVVVHWIGDFRKREDARRVADQVADFVGKSRPPDV
ncbi:MAG: hypothetical protein ACLQVD_01745 [Capsulimonadaceae bacterium]